MRQSRGACPAAMGNMLPYYSNTHKEFTAVHDMKVKGAGISHFPHKIPQALHFSHEGVTPLKAGLRQTGGSRGGSVALVN